MQEIEQFDCLQIHTEGSLVKKIDVLHPLDLLDVLHIFAEQVKIRRSFAETSCMLNNKLEECST